MDPDKVIEETVDIAVQINGKVRGEITVSLTDPVERARELAMANGNIQRYIEGKNIVKEIYVPGKIYNIVVK